MSKRVIHKDAGGRIAMRPDLRYAACSCVPEWKRYTAYHWTDVTCKKLRRKR